MKRRNFLKGLGALTALFATGVELKADVPGKIKLPKPEPVDCGLTDEIKEKIVKGEIENWNGFTFYESSKL